MKKAFLVLLVRLYQGNPKIVLFGVSVYVAALSILALLVVGTPARTDSYDLFRQGTGSEVATVDLNIAGPECPPGVYDETGKFSAFSRKDVYFNAPSPAWYCEYDGATRTFSHLVSEFAWGATNPLPTENTVIDCAVALSDYKIRSIAHLSAERQHPIGKYEVDGFMLLFSNENLILNAPTGSIRLLGLSDNPPTQVELATQAAKYVEPTAESTQVMFFDPIEQAKYDLAHDGQYLVIPDGQVCELIQ